MRCFQGMEYLTRNRFTPYVAPITHTKMNTLSAYGIDPENFVLRAVWQSSEEHGGPDKAALAERCNGMSWLERSWHDSDGLWKDGERNFGRSKRSFALAQ